MAPRRKRIVVDLRERKLGREDAHGQVHNYDEENPLIEIDPRLKGKDRLTVTVHEALHICWPNMTEENVIRHGKLIASILWAENYRRADQ